MRIRPKTLLLLLSPVLLLVAAAYIQWGAAGLPRLTSGPALTPETAAGPVGFPAWLRITHYVNFLFLILLIRSGLQILMDHPRLYWQRPLHSRNRVAPVDAGRGAPGPRVDGQGRLPPPFALDRPARLSPHGRNGPALAFPQRLVLGGQRLRLRRAAVLDGTVEAPGADVLADRARGLGRLRPLRHSPPAAGAKWLLPLQRPPATRVLRGGLRPGPARDPDRSLDVARPDEPVQVVSVSAGQPADRTVDPLSRHVYFRRFPRRSRRDDHDHRVGSEHEPHRAGDRRRESGRPVSRPRRDRRRRCVKRARQLGGVETPTSSPACRREDRHAGHAVRPRPPAYRWPSSAAKTYLPSSGSTARCRPARSGRIWPPTNSRTTGSRCTVWSRTPSSSPWTSSGLSARRPRSRCTTASRAGRASPSGADCRWRN